MRGFKTANSGRRGSRTAKAVPKQKRAGCRKENNRLKTGEFESRPFELFNSGWALVTAGDLQHFNTMTVSWGAMGTLWNKPVVIVFVKPTRYTSEFLAANEYFTVSMYDERYRKVLRLLGTKSGRDCDKVAESGLMPVCAGRSVSFREAYRTFVLKKIYSSQLVADKVPQFAYSSFYGDGDEHIVFIGEVTDIIDQGEQS